MSPHQALLNHCKKEPTFRPLAEWPPDTPLGAYRTAREDYEDAWRRWKARERVLLQAALAHSIRREER